MLWLIGFGTIISILVSLLFSILCTLVPAAGIGWFVYTRWKKSDQMRQASQRWLSTQGTVIKSRVEVSGGEITTISPRVIYTYIVGEKGYQGDQIRAGERFLSARSSRNAYETVDRYPQGASVTVFYNPADPTESALER